MKNKISYSDYLLLTILLVTFIYTVFIIKSLPEKIPLHWNSAGMVDNITDKSFVYIGIVASLIIFVLLTFIFNYGFSKKVLKIDCSIGNNDEKYFKRAFEYAGGVKLNLALIPLLYTISILLFIPDSSPFKFFIITSFLCLVISLFLIIKAVQNLAIYKNGKVISLSETLLRYVGDYNPDDKRVFVDKKIGVGFTVNLATRGGKVFFLVMVIIPLLFIFVLGLVLVLQKI